MALDPVRAERDRNIIEDRIKGMTYPQLAEKYSLSMSTVHDIVAKHIDNTIKPATEQLIELEVLRLDRLLLALEPRIANGDPKAIEVAIKIGESLRKLKGVDAKTKIEIEHTTTPAALELQERLNKALQSHVDETE